MVKKVRKSKQREIFIYELPTFKKQQYNIRIAL